MKTGSTGKRRGQEPPVCTCSACNHCLALGQVSDARLRTWGQEVPRGGWEHPSSFPANRRNTTACAWTLAASSRAGRCRPPPSTRLASPSAGAGGWGSVSPLGRAQVTPKGSRASQLENSPHPRPGWRRPAYAHGNGSSTWEPRVGSAWPLCRCGGGVHGAWGAGGGAGPASGAESRPGRGPEGLGCRWGPLGLGKGPPAPAQVTAFPPSAIWTFVHFPTPL